MQRTIPLLVCFAHLAVLSLTSSPLDHVRPVAVEERPDELFAGKVEDKSANSAPVHSRGSRSTNREEIRIRLANGSSPTEGRLEVLYNGVWGIVCSQAQKGPGVISNARVVCRQLGFYGTAEFLTAGTFGIGPGPLIMRLLTCYGDESSIADCSHTGWGFTPRCTKMRDMSIRCSSNNSIHNVRLVDGPSPSEGRLEVYHNNTWGTVCNTNASIELAIIVCRQLGYVTTVGVTSPEQFGPGKGQIWIDPVCDSRNHSVGDCAHSGWGIHGCDHSKDVGIICADFLPVKLVGGRRASEGRLEVMHDGEWRSICNWDGDIRIGNVACRQLGYPQGASSIPGHAIFGRPENHRMWLTPTCSGNETSLLHCAHLGWGAGCDDSNAAEVICIDDSIHQVASQVAMCSTTNVAVITAVAIILCMSVLYVMVVLAVTFMASRRIKRKVKEMADNGVKFTSDHPNNSEVDGANLQEYNTAPANLKGRGQDISERDPTPDLDFKGLQPPFDNVTLASSTFEDSDVRHLIDNDD